MRGKETRYSSNTVQIPMRNSICADVVKRHAFPGPFVAARVQDSSAQVFTEHVG